MSVGWLETLLPGSGGASFKPSPVELDGVVGTWFAANTRSGLSLAGGQVVLTRDHLVFSPWNMDETRTWLVKWLPKAGVPYVAQVDKLISASGLLEPVAVSLADIESVERLNRASLFKPPTVRLHLRDGRHFDLGILAGPTKPNLSADNNAALDDFLTRMPAPG